MHSRTAAQYYVPGRLRPVGGTLKYRARRTTTGAPARAGESSQPAHTALVSDSVPRSSGLERGLLSFTVP